MVPRFARPELRPKVLKVKEPIGEGAIGVLPRNTHMATQLACVVQHVDALVAELLPDGRIS
jgi:hypothetical protein